MCDLNTASTELLSASEKLIEMVKEMHPTEFWMYDPLWDAMRATEKVKNVLSAEQPVKEPAENE